MPSHISENIAGHMSQLEVYMSTHPGTNISACMALMAGTIQKVSIENIHTHSQLQEAKEELQESHDQLFEAHDQLRELRESRDKLLKSQNEANQKLEQYQEKIAQLERATTTHSTRSEQQEKRIDSHHFAMTQSHKKFSQQVSGLQESIAQQKDELTMMKASEEKLEKSSGKLSFDFTLTEFKSKKENDDNWYSPPFYTHTHGYRMCIRVDANGNGDQKGTHLSVYANLMEGPFDDYLEWPFQGTITIQLLNQLKDVNHHTRTINFTNTTDPTIVGRVAPGGRGGGGFGKHTFLPHTKLDLKSKDDCQYLKDDQLKFRVSS